MFSAGRNNYRDDLLESFDELSVMLDELNELLEEGNVESFWDHLKHTMGGILDTIWGGLSSAAKAGYEIVKKGGKAAIDYCKNNKDTCIELAKKGVTSASEALGK